MIVLCEKSHKIISEPPAKCDLSVQKQKSLMFEMLCNLGEGGSSQLIDISMRCCRASDHGNNNAILWTFRHRMALIPNGLWAAGVSTLGHSMLHLPMACLPNQEWIYSFLDILILNKDQHQHQKTISTYSRISSEIKQPHTTFLDRCYCIR